MTRTSIGLALWGLLLTGCTNAPDALRLDVSPRAPAYQQAKPVCLDVKLSAVRDPVCLSRSHFFVVELQQVDGKATFKSPEQQFRCGTAFIMALPLLPIVVPIALLDVGDGYGRFIVLQRRRDHNQHLVLTLREDRLDAFAVDDLSRWEPAMTTEPFPAGRYLARLRLVNEVQDWFVPCPLFWKPYEGAVTAETTVVIAGSTASSTRTE
jgi:hypothetical protein